MSASPGQWLVLLGYAAILVVLVRPGSQGPAFVEQVGTAMSNLVSASTGGGGTWTSTTSTGVQAGGSASSGTSARG